MIVGVHAIVFTPDADADRAFLRDVLGLPSVDSGGGWLIFGLPPAEIAAHPDDGPPRYELYVMCDEIEATVAELEAKGVTFGGPVTDQGWGLLTSFRLPGGAVVGLYEPRHSTAIAR